MTQGFAVISGTLPVHKLLKDGLASFSGSVEITGSVVPQGDGVRLFGSNDNRWADVYAVQATFGAVFEYNLGTPGISKYPTGTVLVWNNGKAVPSSKKEDTRVIGVVMSGKDQPIILGAEYVLVNGKVNEGDWIVTSDVIGHGCAAKTTTFFGTERNLLGKIIGQALESCDGESTLIKCFIKKL